MTAPRRPWAGRLARTLRALVLARDYSPELGYTPCRWCSAPATTADHWPVARIDGGTDHLDNLVAACGPCNYSHGARLGNLRRSLPPAPSRRW